jgi:hypothetical protein
MNKQLSIPWEVAEGITLASLEDHLKMLKQEVADHLEKGSYLHPEDYENSMFRLIPSLEVLIQYYGGSIK